VRNQNSPLFSKSNHILPGQQRQEMSKEHYFTQKMSTFLTFRGPCIVIYSYNKSQTRCNISQLYLW